MGGDDAVMNFILMKPVPWAAYLSTFAAGVGGEGFHAAQLSTHRVLSTCT